MSDSSIEIPAVIVLVLVVFVVIVLASTNIGQGIFTYLQKYLPAAGEGQWTANTVYDVLSENSFDALSCAIKVVSLSKDDNCVSNFQPSKLSGAQTGTSGNIISIESKYGWLGDGYTGMATEKGTLDISSIPPDERPYLKCTESGKDSSKCTVYNFQLPQYIENAEKYIAGYGDPKYLIYWNMFPISEVTWTFKINWVLHTAIFAISIIPIGKSSFSAAKIAWAGLRGPAKKEMEKVLVKTLIKEGEEKLGQVAATEAAEQAVKFWGTTGGRAGLKAAYQRITGITAWNFMVEKARTEGINLLKSRISKAGITSFFVKGVSLETGAYLAGLWDSINEKFKPVGNALAIKKSYEVGGEIKTLDLPSEWTGKPIILKSVPGLVLTENKPFHLVSPCYLKSFDVTKSQFVCGTYTNSPEDKNSYCMDAKEKFDKSLMTCGIWDKNVDTAMGIDGIYEIINAWKSQPNRKIFEIDESYDNKINTRLYMPWEGKDDYIDLDSAKRLLPSVPATSPGTRSEPFIFSVGVYHSNTAVTPTNLAGTKDQVLQSLAKSISDCYDAYESATDVRCEIFDVSSIPSGVTITYNDMISKLKSDYGFDVIHNLVWFGSDLKDKDTSISKDHSGYLEISISKPPFKYVLINYVNNLDKKSYSAPMHCYYDDEPEFKTEEEAKNYIPFGHCKIFLTTSGISYTVYLDGPQSSSMGDELYQYADSVSFDYEGRGLMKVVFNDDDEDGNWDEIGVHTFNQNLDDMGLENYGIDVSSIENYVLLSDVDKSGLPGHITMKNCQTDGIVIDISEFSDQKMDGENKNYCFFHESKLAAGIKIGTTVLTIGGTIAAMILTRNPTILFIVFAGTAAADRVAAIYGEFKQAWPGPT